MQSVLDPMDQYYWPPKDPYRDPPVKERPIGSSPWTFGENELNPALVPSNSSRRATSTADVPPYHPSFGSREYNSDASTSSSPERESHSSNEYLPIGAEGSRRRDGWQMEDEEVDHPGMRMRRGSEGWEATMPDRFAQLRDEAPLEAFAVVDETPDDLNRGRKLSRI
jgi:hypothetical protein